MSTTPIKSDYDYYITIKLQNGSILNPYRIVGIDSIADMQAYADTEQAKRPLDKVYWLKYLEDSEFY